jgi:hypothetical protein
VLPWERPERSNSKSKRRPETTDETQIESDDNTIPVPPAPGNAGPVVVARDEIARSSVRVISDPKIPRPERKEPKEPKESGRELRTDRLDRPPPQERSNPTGARIPMPQPAAPRSVVPILAAAGLGMVIGAAVIGIAAMLRSPGGVDTVIVTSPRQAEVKKGDVVLCQQTPCGVALGTGTHELAFRAPGAEGITKSVEVKGGEIAQVDVALERYREDVRLESEPNGAQVWLDDKLLPSTTPITLPRLVVGSSVRLRLKHPEARFQAFEISKVVDDAPIWRFDLPTSITSYTIATDPADALVYVNGERRDDDAKVTLTVGPTRPVTVRALRPGCRGVEKKVTPNGRAEGVEKLVLDCKDMSRSGVILDVAKSKKTTVKIDDIELSRTAAWNKYPLPPGNWTVSIRQGKGRGKTDEFNFDLRDGEYKPVQTNR